MTMPGNDVVNKVRQWLASAEDGLTLARHGLGLGDRCPFHLVAYHAQQCAEKHLKCYLVWRGVDFPYTHNIARLLELCVNQQFGSAQLEEAVELTPFAVTARYPSEDMEVTPKEAERAIEIAARVREILRTQLQTEGLTLEP